MKGSVQYSSTQQEYKVILEHDGVIRYQIIPEVVLKAVGKTAADIYAAVDSTVERFNKEKT